MGWVLDAHSREITSEVADFPILPPGGYHLAETVSDTVPNQICRVPLSAPNDLGATDVKTRTLFLPSQTINQCEHAARIGEPSLR